MNPGELKQKLIFQVPAGGQDEDGFPIEQPTTYLTARAKLKTLRGRNFYTAAQTNMEHNREFLIRYRKELLDEVRPPKLQVLWRGKKHDIESIEDDDGLRTTMTVIVKAVS